MNRRQEESRAKQGLDSAETRRRKSTRSGLKTFRILIAAIALVMVSTADADAQGLLKRLGNAAKNAAERTLERKTEQKTEEAVGKAVDKVTDPDTYKGDGNDQQPAQQQQQSIVPAGAGNNGSQSAGTDALGVKAEKDDAVFEITVRDFKADKILFESNVSYEKIKGMVQPTLGTDKKPVYNLQVWKNKYGNQVTQQMLDGLLYDTPGYNMSTPKTLVMKA